MSDNGTRPSVSAYLDEHGLSDEALAELVGVQVKTVQARKSERDRPMPKAWADRLEAGDPNVSQRGREEEQEPKAPRDARVVEPEPEPLDVDFASFAGTVAGVYHGAASYVISDPILANIVHENAEKAGEAWARWAQSDPRVAAWLERMMVSTPLGEVVMVHVGIGAGYVFARAAVARQREEERRAREPEPSVDDVDDPLFAESVAA